MKLERKEQLALAEIGGLTIGTRQTFLLESPADPGIRYGVFKEGPDEIPWTAQWQLNKTHGRTPTEACYAVLGMAEIELSSLLARVQAEKARIRALLEAEDKERTDEVGCV